jgi:hypothetical protein
MLVAAMVVVKNAMFSQIALVKLTFNNIHSPTCTYSNKKSS